MLKSGKDDVNLLLCRSITQGQVLGSWGVRVRQKQRTGYLDLQHRRMEDLVEDFCRSQKSDLRVSNYKKGDGNRDSFSFKPLCVSEE